MSSFTITNVVTGATLGTYEAKTPQEALDALARDSGYADYEDACDAKFVTESEIVVTAA